MPARVEARPGGVASHILWAFKAYASGEWAVREITEHA